MPDTVTLTARLIPGTESPPLRSSRCVLRPCPFPLGCAWTGAILVSCGERETTLLLVVKPQKKGWRVETSLYGEEDPCSLSIGLENVSGPIPAFVTSEWHFLNTDWGVRLVVEPAE